MVDNLVVVAVTINVVFFGSFNDTSALKVTVGTFVNCVTKYSFQSLSDNIHERRRTLTVKRV